MAALPTLASSTAENGLMEMIYKVSEIQQDSAQNANNVNIVRNLSITANNDLQVTLVLPLNAPTFDTNGFLVRSATESLVSA